MANDMFFGYQESQAHAGYRSAILYREQGESKYRFLCASETVPFPFGTKETFEYNLLNAATLGQVEGKDSIEQKEVELLYTRNNALLFEKLKGKVLDFMSLTPQMVGYKYNGTIAFRPNDASNDIHRGTYTITPMSADTTPYYMAREEVLVPLYFASTIPDEISLASLPQDATKISINLAVKNADSANFKYDTIVASTNRETGVLKEITITEGVGELPKEKGLYVIYAEPTTTGTHSGCFATVYVTD